MNKHGEIIECAIMAFVLTILVCLMFYVASSEERTCTYCNKNISTEEYVHLTNGANMHPECYIKWLGESNEECKN